VDAVRWKMGLLYALGLAFLLGGLVCGGLAINQAGLASAYSHAASCPVAAAFNADCRQTVSGSVAAVEEISGKDAHYELDVQVGAHMLDITFPFDDPMLGYASDGDRAEVTVWRGIPVAVTTDGRSAIPASLPGFAVATDLGRCMECLGIGLFFLLGPLLTWRQRRVGRRVLGPLGVAGLTSAGLGSVTLAAAGFLLAGNPDEPATVLLGTAVALVVVLALGAWAGTAAKRRNRNHPELAALHRSLPVTSRERQPGPRPRPRPAVPLRARLGYRLRPSSWLPGLWALLKKYVAPALVVLVLFGLFLTVNDAPNARAFHDAPACQGETNLNVCAGEFTAVVNGVRTTSANAGSPSISYATSDGAINAWGSFPGNAEALADTAQAEETTGAPVRIEVWRQAIVGAEISGSWHWASGNPPGDKAPAVFLVLSLTLLLSLVRARAHLSTHTDAARRTLLGDDLGQITASAAGYGLLFYGHWYGALLILAVLGWMGWTARRNARIRAGRRFLH
jgi:hypothetical protein